MSQLTTTGQFNSGLTVTNGKVNFGVLTSMAEETGMPSREICLTLSESVEESKEIWQMAMESMRKTEKSVGAVLTLDEKPKLYALDAVTVYKELGVPEEIRKKAAEMFSLYYLAVHLFDDVVEDQEKLTQKFHINGEDATVNDVGAFIASFALNLGICFTEILDGGDPSLIKNFIRSVNQSLGKQFTYFMMEKNTEMSSREVLKAKQHNVSGESTAFMVDCLEAAGFDVGTSGEDLRKGLFFMGSLTQFMDDLRDWDEDKENGNLNLFIAVENEQDEDTIRVVAQMYKKEEDQMVSCLQNMGIENIDILRAIPWYPFYMKHLI